MCWRKKGDQKREIIKKCMTSERVRWMDELMDGCIRGGETFCAEEFQSGEQKLAKPRGPDMREADKQNSREILSVYRKSSRKISSFWTANREAQYAMSSYFGEPFPLLSMRVISYLDIVWEQAESAREAEWRQLLFYSVHIFSASCENGERLRHPPPQGAPKRSEEIRLQRNFAARVSQRMRLNSGSDHPGARPGFNLKSELTPIKIRLFPVTAAFRQFSNHWTHLAKPCTPLRFSLLHWSLGIFLRLVLKSLSEMVFTPLLRLPPPPTALPRESLRRMDGRGRAWNFLSGQNGIWRGGKYEKMPPSVSVSTQTCVHAKCRSYYLQCNLYKAIFILPHRHCATTTGLSKRKWG